MAPAGGGRLAGLPEAVEAARPAGQAAAAAAEEPGGVEACAPPNDSAAVREQAKKRRPSMLQWMLSAAALPLRGRTVSSGGGNEGSSGAECQSRTVSVMSEGAVAAGTTSLAELSSEPGRHGGCAGLLASWGGEGCRGVSSLHSQADQRTRCMHPWMRAQQHRPTTCRRAGPSQQRLNPKRRQAPASPPPAWLLWQLVPARDSCASCNCRHWALAQRNGL